MRKSPGGVCIRGLWIAVCFGLTSGCQEIIYAAGTSGMPESKLHSILCNRDTSLGLPTTHNGHE